MKTWVIVFLASIIWAGLVFALLHDLVHALIALVFFNLGPPAADLFQRIYGRKRS